MTSDRPPSGNQPDRPGAAALRDRADGSPTLQPWADPDWVRGVEDRPTVRWIRLDGLAALQEARPAAPAPAPPPPGRPGRRPPGGAPPAPRGRAPPRPPAATAAPTRAAQAAPLTGSPA